MWILFAGYMILFIAAYKIYQKLDTLHQEKQNILQEIYSLHLTEEETNKKMALLKEKEDFFNKIFETNVADFPVLATIVADFEAKRNEYIALTLNSKRSLAFSTMERLRKLKEENKTLSAQVMAYKWEIEHLQKVVLWIKEIENAPLGLGKENKDLNAMAALQIKLMRHFVNKLEVTTCERERTLQIEETKLSQEKEEHEKWLATSHNAITALQSQAEKDIARMKEQAESNTVQARAEITQEIAKKKESLQKIKQLVTLNIHQRQAKLKEKEEAFKAFMEAKISTLPTLATMVADYEAKRDEYIAATIEKFRPRAFRAIEQVRKLKDEKRVLSAQALAYKWELAAIHAAIPWIDDIADEPIIPAETDYKTPHYAGTDDSAGYWLTVEEYQKLPTSEKYQLALDRYTKRNKSNAEIGRDYERYIGYLYEQVGFSVSYFGIEKGMEDLGRDLICKKDGEIHIVQCKCWSKKKTIHEKHINQLFGTTVMYYLTNINPSGSLTDFYNYISDGRLIPTFAATTDFSETAQKFAKGLGIALQKIDLRPYPLIKCNIGREGEKIYHLPFDQQYDRVKIDPPHEFMVMTVAEAESKGFRRAMRWLGNH